MRQYKNYYTPATRRTGLTVFGGYHHRPVIDRGEWYDMKNLTSDDYPLLSVRKAREAYAAIDGSTTQDCVALHSRSDHPVVIDGHGTILCHGHTLAGLLTTEDGAIPAALLPKKTVSIGAMCVIFPDKVWFNAVKLASGDTMTQGADYGSLENETRVKKGTAGYVGGETVRFTPVYRSNAGFLAYSADRITYSDSPPQNPTNGVYWCDTGGDTAALWVYSEAQGCWSPVLSAYLQITAVNTDDEPISIGAGFRTGDGIEISGLLGHNVQAAEASPVRSQIEALNGAHVLVDCADNRLVIEGCVGAALTSAVNASIDTDIVFSRTVPQMDYVVECGNRLWGCKYGLVNGERVNELYASKLGDFKNWSAYSGISTDSYAASRGAEGEFTGAAVLNDTPLFFREHSFEKVYPAADGGHRVRTVKYPGIQPGSWQSAQVIGGVLYYKATDGVYAYSGSIPRRISYKLGDTPYFDAVAGCCGTKYYLSMRNAAQSGVLFVYDTARELWHREDETHFRCTAYFQGCLYYVAENAFGERIGGVSVCTNVPWFAESGMLGLDLPEQKRIGRLTLRLQLELDAQVRISVQYNSDGVWHEKAALFGNRLQSATVPIVPVRCDHLRLRLEGIGGVRLYSITYQTQQGSDIP